MPSSSSTSTLPLPRRVLLISVGSAIAAYGYLHTVAADLGNGPLFAVQDGLRVQAGLSLAASAVLLGLALVAVAAALRAPLGVGTVLLPILNGMWISLFAPSVMEVSGVAGRAIQFVVGTVVMMLGAVLAVGASFGTAAMDGVMFGLARRLGVPAARARLGMEVTLALTGAVLGGSVGVGTVAMGASVGHLFQFWSRTLRRVGVAVEPQRA